MALAVGVNLLIGSARPVGGPRSLQTESRFAELLAAGPPTLQRTRGADGFANVALSRFQGLRCLRTAYICLQHDERYWDIVFRGSQGLFRLFATDCGGALQDG